MSQIGIGLLGCGTVGTGVLRLLSTNRTELESVLHARMEVRRIAVRDPDKTREVDVSGTLGTDPEEVVSADDVDVVVELIGGVEKPYELVMKAISLGKPVVTANKALMAAHGTEILAAADEAGVGVYFEAAVAGGIPILRALRQGLAANRIDGIWGIVNGTSNYILTEMARNGSEFDSVLAEAQWKGFAEADPALDVDGGDAAQKLCVLVASAYGLSADADAVFTQGIRDVTPLDLEFAEELGYMVRPLAIATRVGDTVTLRVHPTMVPAHHLLADVDGVFNAVFVKGDPVGPTLHFGRGAGAGPTASAVVSDLIDAVRSHGARPLGFPRPAETLALGDVGDVECEYYLRFGAWDRPGVLSRITGVLGTHGISIAQLLQREQAPEESVPVVVLTHRCAERNLAAAIAEIDQQSDVVSDPTMVIRVEDLEVT